MGQDSLTRKHGGADKGLLLRSFLSPCLPGALAVPMGRENSVPLLPAWKPPPHGDSTWRLPYSCTSWALISLTLMGIVPAPQGGHRLLIAAKKKGLGDSIPIATPQPPSPCPSLPFPPPSLELQRPGNCSPQLWQARNLAFDLVSQMINSFIK